MKKILAVTLAISAVGFLFPYAVNAAGLVPCGGPGQSQCQFCHLFILFDNIVDFVLFTLVPPIAVLMLVIGGAMLFFAAGNPGKLTDAKSIFSSVIIGLILVYGAWVIAGLFFATIGVSDWTGLESGWFTFNCAP